MSSKAGMTLIYLVLQKMKKSYPARLRSLKALLVNLHFQKNQYNGKNFNSNLGEF